MVKPWQQPIKLVKPWQQSIKLVKPWQQLIKLARPWQQLINLVKPWDLSSQQMWLNLSNFNNLLYTKTVKWNLCKPNLIYTLKILCNQSYLWNISKYQFV